MTTHSRPVLIFAKIFSILPYYRILIHYDDGSSLKCIRQHNSWDIEFVSRYFAEQMKKNNRLRTVSEMEVVMVTRQSKEVKDYINAQVRRGQSE